MANEVAEKGGSSVVEFDAAIFEQDKMQETLGKEDLALPFLKVLSRQDPTLDDLPDAKPGDIYNTVTQEVYNGAEGVRVVPCAYERRFLEWVPRGQGTGAPVNIYSPDQERPETVRDPDTNRDNVVGGESYIEETHQHYVLILEEDGSFSTALLAMKSTQLKKSRKWNSMIASRTMSGQNGPFTPPRYSHVYHLKTVAEENSKGSWHGWDISLQGQVDELHLYQTAKSFSETVSAGDVEVRHTTESGDGDGDNAPF
jgi:hypothetical protein